MQNSFSEPGNRFQKIDMTFELTQRNNGVFRREIDVSVINQFANKISIHLPLWTKALYFAPFQRHSIDPKLDIWPDGLNQCQPLPVASLGEVKRGGMFLLLKLQTGGYLALLPITNARTMASFISSEGSLSLEIAHYGIKEFKSELPVLAFAHSTNPYIACHDAWKSAFGDPMMEEVGILRESKKYPVPFDYLGWCSFEEFKLNITEEKIIEAISVLNEGEVPIRWILVDDGHVYEDGVEPLETREGAHSKGADPLTRLVKAAGTHPGKFPNGWRSIRKTMEGSRISWLGIWLNFNGYWGCLDPEGEWPDEIRKDLILLKQRRSLPSTEKEAQRRFWDYFLEPAVQSGVDFLKVDNQCANLSFYADCVPNAVEASGSFKQALESEVSRSFSGYLINCMAHNGIGIFHMPCSSIIRCSEDYWKGDRWRAKHHIHNSFGNMLWLSAVAWGDHDMFHSTDQEAAGMMARSKALSGGPIYLSDHPAHIVSELVLPLCLRDGKILRAEEPAVPLLDSLFLDPYEAEFAFRVGTILKHGSVAIGLYNLAHPDRTVQGFLVQDDFSAIYRMFRRTFAIRDWDGEVVVFDPLSQEIWLLDSPGRFILPPMGDRLFILSPVVNDVAVIGCPDKYLSTSFITDLERKGSRIVIEVPEKSRIFLWSKKKLRGIGTECIKMPADCWEILFDDSLHCEIEIC